MSVLTTTASIPAIHSLLLDRSSCKPAMSLGKSHTTAAKHDRAQSVRVVISQEDEIISEMMAVSESTSTKVLDEVITTYDPTSSNKTNIAPVTCLCLDTEKPFVVDLFRHKDCHRLESGFWHTESLNGRMRMGNVMDRTPHEVQEPSSAFPFPQQATWHAKHSKSFHLPAAASNLQASNQWIACGSLIHKVAEGEGMYKLRISPSLNHTKEDFLVEFCYRSRHSSACCSANQACAATIVPSIPERRSLGSPKVNHKIRAQGSAHSHFHDIATVYSNSLPKRRSLSYEEGSTASNASSTLNQSPKLSFNFRDMNISGTAKRKFRASSPLDSSYHWSGSEQDHAEKLVSHKRFSPRSQPSSPPLWFPETSATSGC